MFELYLDTADIKYFQRFYPYLPLRGLTTNPSLLAKTGRGVQDFLAEIDNITAGKARIHVQTIAQSVEEMVSEARELSKLPYDIVVKVPATEKGMSAIKQLSLEGISVLATAIYSVQQGFMAALNGAEYLAPYVNRIDALGNDGIKVVADLQALINRYSMPTKLLPASFKSIQQVLEILKIGPTAITLSPEVMEQFLIHPVVDKAVDQFLVEWQSCYGNQLSFQT